MGGSVGEGAGAGEGSGGALGAGRRRSEGGRRAEGRGAALSPVLTRPLTPKTPRPTRAQVAFADRILLNKLDLVSVAEKEAVVARLRAINRTVEVIEATHSVVDLDRILGISAFSMEKCVPRPRPCCPLACPARLAAHLPTCRARAADR